MNQELVFATPLWKWWYPSPAALEPLAQRVLQLQKSDPEGLQLTNQGGWHSKTTLLEDRTFHGLFEWIAMSVQEALLGIGWDFEIAQPRFNNAWAIVNRRGDGIRAHIHPNSLFSGVLYLEAGEDSGDIAFLDPRGGAQMLQYPIKQQARRDSLHGRIAQSPGTGLLLVFPSWLWHEVGPSKSEQDRISISFNIGLQPVTSTEKPEHA